jgi:hypothetical protein
MLKPEWTRRWLGFEVVCSLSKYDTYLVAELNAALTIFETAKNSSDVPDTTFETYNIVTEHATLITSDLIAYQLAYNFLGRVILSTFAYPHGS